MRRVRKHAAMQTDASKLVVRQERSSFFARRHTCAIQNMLEQERVDLGNMQGLLDWLDLNALIIEVVEQMRPLAGQESIHLHLAHLLPLLRGDRNKLAQVIEYLLNNAIIYSPHNGKICIRSYVEGPTVHVCVQHRGGNIPTTTSGLLLVRQIVRMHGGELWAENIPGEGRDFHFTLSVIR